MTRPRLLDLFCGAGGAAMGYYRAGFDVVGVDIKPMPRYPFEFHQGDALEYCREHGAKFDAIHASPPCQAYSDLKTKITIPYPKLISETREALESLERPFVIENVDGAPLNTVIILCGTMFGLRVIRHRLFETSFLMLQPSHTSRHPLVYTLDKRKGHYGKLNDMTSFVSVNGGGNCSITAARDAMGIDWMTKDEINEAIPPAYTEFIGAHLMRYLSHSEG